MILPYIVSPNADNSSLFFRLSRNRLPSQELKQMLDGCDIAGYNSNRFDIPMLVEEFLRA